MSKRYTYSRTLSSFEGIETFTATEFDSFEEAKTAVDKGIRDRKLELEKLYQGRDNLGGIRTDRVNVPGTVSPGQVLPHGVGIDATATAAPASLIPKNNQTR